MRVITESLSPPDVERMKAVVSRLAGRPADGPEGAADDVTIELLVIGGCPGERVQFRASIPSRGAAEVSHVDELRGVSERFSAAIRPEELAALARRLDVDALTKLPPNADERYLPDSLVGSVIITAGNSRITLWFSLDEEVPPAGEEAAMTIDPGKGPFVLGASMAPPSVRPALEQLAVVVNGLFQGRP
jgi:hypothetical protein